MQNLLRYCLFTLFNVAAIGNTSIVLADQVILKNNDRLSGAIVKADFKSLVLKTEFAGTVTIDWGAVQELSSSLPLYVTSQKGQVLMGTLSTTDGRVDVETKETGRVELARETIVAIRSEDEQKLYDAWRERLEHPHLLDYWSGAADAG